MPEPREGDEREPFPILLKNVVPVVPKKESELQEVIEDLRFRGCEGCSPNPGTSSQKTP